MTKPKEKPVVRLKRSGYQPTKAEMEGDVSVDGSGWRRAHAGQDRIRGRARVMPPNQHDDQ